MKEHPVIFFDGVCNLCNSAVRFIIKRDPKALFKFSALQNALAKDVLAQTPEQANVNSFILMQNNKVYVRSTAALRVARQLQGPVKLLYGFIIVPRFLRDWFYDIIARNRYNWFGRKDECMMPNPKLSERFLN